MTIEEASSIDDLTTRDAWTLTTTYGTFTLSVTGAGNTSDDDAESTAEFAVTLLRSGLPVD